MRNKKISPIIIVSIVFALSCQPITQINVNPPTAEENVTSLPIQIDIVETSTPNIGSTIISEKDSMTLVFIPAGEFTMGTESVSSYEQPVHQVYLDAYWIDQTEVTNTMYRKCVEDGFCTSPSSRSSYSHNDYYDNPDFDNYPVIYIDWHQATTYCEWVERRLPTEAEWEKAARGTDARTYPWGNAFDGTKVNYCDSNCDLKWADTFFDDRFKEVAPVGSYPDGKSTYGLLDMAGNVDEWVSDWVDLEGSDYSSSPTSNPQGPDSGVYKHVRGGSWRSTNTYLYSAFSGGYLPQNTYFDLGFRCVRPETQEVAIQITEPAPIATTGSDANTLSEKDNMPLVSVSAGEFIMGRDFNTDEQPVHKVYLDTFWIDQIEITNAMYSKCVNEKICNPPRDTSSATQTNYFGNSQFANYPVIHVSWHDAIAYCEWAGRRLPTEAEWEKAARGTDGRIYPWEDPFPYLPNVLNFNFHVGGTTEAGSYPLGASVYGALDMAGNVSEWVNDWYDESYYSKSPSSNPQGPNSGQQKVIRGGSWVSESLYVASANRDENDPTYTNYTLGFRCAQSD